jgi:hypothetical protein
MTILSKTLVAAALASAGFIGSTAFAASLVTNGSFETGINAPAASNFFYRSLLPGNMDITGWTIFGDSVGWYDDAHPGLNSPNVVIHASNGHKFIDLTDQSGGAPFGGIKTVVSTVIGTKYTLTFDLGTSKFYNPVTGASAALTIGDIPFNIFTAVTGGNPGIWFSKSLTFTATTANTNIGFLGWAGKDFIGLDNVAVAAVVPEPGSVALMLAGLAIVGSVAARRRPQR